MADEESKVVTIEQKWVTCNLSNYTTMQKSNELVLKFSLTITLKCNNLRIIN
jgi:hypothetical protein